MDHAPPILATRPHPVTLFVSLLLLALGALVAYTGWTAIRTRHYEFTWTEGGSLTLGPVEFAINHDQGVDHFIGNDAIRVGAGLVAFGFMLAFWGLASAYATLRPAALELGASTCVALCFLSMILQTVALLCIFPPWRIGAGIAPAFWVTVLFLTMVLIFNVRSGAELSRKMKRGSRAVAALAAVIAVAALLTHGGRWWCGSVLALFATLSYATHIFFMHWLLRGRR